jgi:hypothetical protein
VANLLPIGVLLEQGLLNWSALVVGWNHKWATREDVVQYAVNWLVAHPDDHDESIVSLAGSESSSEEDIKEWLCQVALCLERFDIADDAQYHLQMDRWRYAFLVSLQAAELSDGEKIERLQRIYADFGYPQDMAGCSKYGPGPDPLETMNAVIERLRTIIFQNGGGYTNAPTDQNR